jgi:hypothetical protein
MAKKLTETEAALEKKRSVRDRNKKQQRELIAQEDGVIELKYRLKLEKVEYLNLKMITPDFEEVSDARPNESRGRLARQNPSAKETSAP